MADFPPSVPGVETPSPATLGVSHPSNILSGFGVPLGVLPALSTRVCLGPVLGVMFGRKGGPLSFGSRRALRGVTAGCAVVVVVVDLDEATLGVRGGLFPTRTAAALSCG